MGQIPYVSVIVPMYNAEKYIGLLLDSVLVQTLKNFELIIVDDGSTDKSCEIVESYYSKFNGRLQLVRLPKNNGHPAVPRNRGLELSRGKYVFFMDADDALTKTALAEMFLNAEKFKAELLYCKYSYVSDGVGEDFLKKVRGGVPAGENKAQFVTEDLANRTQAWLRRYFRVEPWCKLVLRDFLIQSGIRFMPVFQDDSIWTLELICTAKKFLLIPSACYIYRLSPDSFSKVTPTDTSKITKNIRRKMERTIRALKSIDEFLSGIEFFAKRPDYRYALIQSFMMIDLQWLQVECSKLPPHTVKDICQREFKDALGDYGELVAYLFANSITLTRDLILARRKLRELTATPSTDTK